ncbi:MAG: hypothetical protein LBQ48_04720, partial [Oscillospiraceae bacterium]|nr:hypothetical protein [Oscillospiraceae bacterium]
MLNFLKVRRKRFIALVIAFAIAAATLGVYINHRPGTNSTLDAQAQPQELSPIVAEDITRRGEYEKHFVRQDGSYAAAPYAHAVHYLSNGEWQEYDNTLEEVDGQDGAVLSNRDNPVSMSFAAETSGFLQTSGLLQPENSLVAVEQDGYGLSWNVFAVQAGGNGELTPIKSGVSPEIIKADTTGLSGDALRTAVTKNRSELVYRGVFGKDIDIRYTLFPSKVKEDFVVKSKNDIVSYVTKINVNKLTPVLLNDNSVSFNDTDGTEVFTMPAPYMTDSADEYSGDIAVSLEKSGEGEYTLTLTPDSGWLNDPQRVYPVIIDPTVTSDNSALNVIDTYTHPGDTAMQHRLEYFLRFGNRSGEINRVYIKHATLPNIPANTTITS